jgi:hypothetical protein
MGTPVVEERDTRTSREKQRVQEAESRIQGRLAERYRQDRRQALAGLSR